MPQDCGLSLPVGQVEDTERDERRKAKAANFRLAAEAKKKLIEQERGNRVKRNQVFAERAVQVAEAEREEKLQRFQQQEKRLVRAMCKVWTTQDFATVRILGKGAFGVVHLARQCESGRYVALKQMPKSRYREKNLRERAFAERQILAEVANRWFVDLLATFQDQDHFYMVMEFVQGGDLLTHLEIKKRFSEAETRFYMAELLEALDVVHRAGFVHRDIKPDNVVLSVEGHLKLLDFGLCKPDPTAEDDPIESWGQTARRQRMGSVRGTPQYMAPEAITGEVCPAGDFWAMGVMVYECLSGSVPFYAGTEQGHQANMKIVEQVRNHREFFAKRLERAKAKGCVKPAAESLLLGLICEAKQRLTAEQLRQEPFFSGVDFATIHLQQPPIVPGKDLTGPTDARFFPEGLGSCELPDAAAGPVKDLPLEWALYEFNRETHDLQQPRAVEALFESPTTATSREAAGSSSDETCAAPPSP